MTNKTPAGVEIVGPISPAVTDVLTPDALAFVAALHRQFNDRRLERLQARRERQKRFDAGEIPGFLPETASVRAAEWKVASRTGRPQRSPGRNHRADRAQDDDQRAEFRRQGLHG